MRLNWTRNDQNSVPSQITGDYTGEGLLRVEYCYTSQKIVLAMVIDHIKPDIKMAQQPKTICVMPAISVMKAKAISKPVQMTQGRSNPCLIPVHSTGTN